jgi:AraC family transcriptional regulator
MFRIFLCWIHMSVTARALWYIESHLGGNLTLESIAQHVGVSRYHLSRAFSTATGCGLALYVRGRRLSLTAKALLDGAPGILSVALNAGYGSHEAFTRAFRQHFGLTPEQARAQRPTINLNFLEPIRMQTAATTRISPARIAERDAMLIFGLSQHYTPQSMSGIPSQWQRFLPHFGHIPTQLEKSAYGVIYNAHEAGNFDYICGAEVSEFPSHPHEFARLRIPPQTYAVFLHPDHISSIGATCNAIWNQALPDSGYKAADSPWFERYSEEFNRHTGLGGLEIWIPIVRLGRRFMTPETS